MKTKTKISFPEESEIFMAEEFLEAIHDLPWDKTLEIDFSSVESFDTVFFQIAVSLIKKAKEKGQKVTLKVNDTVKRVEELYGFELASVAE